MEIANICHQYIRIFKRKLKGNCIECKLPILPLKPICGSNFTIPGKIHLILVVLNMSFLKPNIPHICQFCYTATLLRPVKSTPKSAYVATKLPKSVKVSQKKAKTLSTLFSGLLVVVIYMSYAPKTSALIK